MMVDITSVLYSALSFVLSGLRGNVDVYKEPVSSISTLTSIVQLPVCTV